MKKTSSSVQKKEQAPKVSRKVLEKQLIKYIFDKLQVAVISYPASEVQSTTVTKERFCVLDFDIVNHLEYCIGFYPKYSKSIDDLNVFLLDNQRNLTFVDDIEHRDIVIKSVIKKKAVSQAVNNIIKTLHNFEVNKQNNSF